MNPDKDGYAKSEITEISSKKRKTTTFCKPNE